MCQEGEMSIEEKARESLGPRVLTNQSISAFFVTNKVTSRRIVRKRGTTVVLPFKLRWRPMKMVMRVRVH